MFFDQTRVPFLQLLKFHFFLCIAKMQSANEKLFLQWDIHMDIELVDISIRNPYGHLMENYLKLDYPFFLCLASIACKLSSVQYWFTHLDIV